MITNKEQTMKLKYTLGALAAVSALAGCSLDVNMYDGVTGEDVTARNIVELSQGSYSMLKYDGGLIDYGYYFWAYGADDLSWGVLLPIKSLISMTTVVTLPVPLLNMPGSWVTVPSAIAIKSLKWVMSWGPTLPMRRR